MVRKTIRFDKRAEKEVKAFPITVQVKTKALLMILARDGTLIEPYGKKISQELFEVRVRCNGQWRLLYAYVLYEEIIVLSAFHKKTQKTPYLEIKKAKNRLKEYTL